MSILYDKDDDEEGDDEACFTFCFLLLLLLLLPFGFSTGGSDLEARVRELRLVSVAVEDPAAAADEELMVFRFFAILLF